MSKPTYASLKRYCMVCGKEVGILGIERYGHGNGYLCYDCDQAYLKERKEEISRVRRSASDRKTRGIKSMYNKGSKPSEIAKKYGISTEEVYKRLNSSVR